MKRFFAYMSLCAVLVSVVACAPSEEYLRRQSLHSGAPGDKARYVRVLIKKTDDVLSVAAEDMLRISDVRSGKILYGGESRVIRFIPQRINDPLRIEAGKLITVNGAQYRGTLELVRVVDDIYVINVVSLEDYLKSVVASEMMAGWPAEALKAQAVAARSYACHHLFTKKPGVFDLDATTNFQVYKGVSVEKETSNLAVDQTAGQVLTWKNQPIVAFFHSTCGGHTISNSYVWKGEALPYLVGRECPFCRESPHYSWSCDIEMRNFKTSLRRKYPNAGDIRGIAFKRESGRVIEVDIQHTSGQVRLTGNEFRMMASADKIRSLLFETGRIPGGLRINGKGWGHGVGMCQYGARGMALKGNDYRTILKYYYKDVDLISLAGDTSGK